MLKFLKIQTQQTFFLVKMSGRHLSSPPSEDVFKMSTRPLGHEEYIFLGHTSSEDVLKTFSGDFLKMSLRRLDQGKYIRLTPTS